MKAEELLIAKAVCSEVELQLVKSYIALVDDMREDYKQLQRIVEVQNKEITILKKQIEEYNVFWEG